MAGGERIPGTPRYRHHLLKNAGTEPFIPNFLLKEWIAGSVFLLAFTLWIVFNPVHLGARANPEDTSFIPVPDWYFLFLYQMLKYYPGNGLIFGWPGGFFGGVLVPGVSSLLLMFAPWLSPKQTRHPYKRPLATTAMVLTVLLTIWLTNEASVQHLAEVGGGSASSGLPKVPTIAASQIHFTDTSMPGYKVFESQCATCHGTKGEGKIGPAIYGIGKFWNQKQLTQFVTTGKAGMPPKGGLTSEAQVKEVTAWLVKQKNSGK